MTAKSETERSGNPLFDDLEVWPEPVDGGPLLVELAGIYSDHLALPTHAADALALWTLQTYVFSMGVVCPVLAIVSPEKRCGKTTLLSLLNKLVNRPLAVSNATTAGLFRSIEKWAPTLLIDEADTFLRYDKEMTGIVNSGYTRDTAYVLRTEGLTFEPRRFSTWCPKAIAAIGDLPGTIEDRSITVRLERKLPEQKIKRLRASDSFPELRRKCLRWASDNVLHLSQTSLESLDTLNDRAADSWDLILRIASLCGAAWVLKAQQAALALSGDDAIEENSHGTLLLADIRNAFRETGKDRLSSVELREWLYKQEDRPWSEYHDGKWPISARQIAWLLGKFGINPRTIRLANGSTPKGYLKEQFSDAFARYLRLSATTPQNNPNQEQDRVENLDSSAGETPHSPQITAPSLEKLRCGGLRSDSAMTTAGGSNE